MIGQVKRVRFAGVNGVNRLTFNEDYAVVVAGGDFHEVAHKGVVVSVSVSSGCRHYHEAVPPKVGGDGLFVEVVASSVIDGNKGTLVWRLGFWCL